MKYRRDYVTNSSSNGFLLARKGSFTQEQKEKIIAWAEKEFLGRLSIPPGDKDGWKELAKKIGLNKETLEEGARLLDKGYSIWSGQAENFIGGDDLFPSFWSLLEGEGFQMLAEGFWDL